MSRHLFPVTLQKIIEIAENKTVANPFLLVTDLLLQLGIQFQYRSQVSPTAQTSSIPFPFYLISSESAGRLFGRSRTPLFGRAPPVQIFPHDRE